LVEGEEKGILKGKHQVALKCIENGLSNDMIASITGLSPDEIEILRHKIL